ncbi:MAG: tetratricopeptide repeat protein [Oscillibacter sp.]|nr:tetratricopeptide repeat protein [Oscillibacter sp.]
MNRWKFLLAALFCAVCLTAAASAEAPDTVSLRLAYADGTEIVKTAALPENGDLWCVFWEPSGRMAYAELAASRGSGGTVELSADSLSIPETADAVSLFALRADLSPLLSGGRTALGALSEDYAALYQEGTDLLSGGDWEGAVNVFTAAIIKDGTQPLAHVGRGDALAGLSETEENLSAAQKDYETALSLDETCAGAYLGKADVSIRQGDYEKAEEILKEGAEKAADAGEIQKKLEAIQGGNITDAQGKERRTSVYMAGKLVFRLDFAYNEKGVKTSVTAFDGAGTQTGYVDFEYDEAGRETVTYTYGIGEIDGEGYGTLYRVENEYDEYGNCVTEREYNMDGSAGYTLRYEYNGQFLIRRSFYNSEDSLVHYEMYTYDAANPQPKQWIRRDDYDAKANRTSYYTAVWREDGKISEMCYYTRDQNYDIDDTNAFKLDSRHVSKYDENGRCIGETSYDGDGNIISEQRFD